MSYRHAFHTSCRVGLAGHPGFQFNATSPGLSDEELRELAAAHAGYQTPPDAPPEPTAEELGSFPIALRYCPVKGLGPVISHTTYVGREFRGRDGEPDSGRFGNYFSHIVIGQGGSEPFSGLLPIELWGAPHWSRTESANRELAPLDTLSPGSLGLETSLASLSRTRQEWLAPVLDACIKAATNGPRAVIVEADAALAPHWVVWASFALPQDRIETFTFVTFDGDPRYGDRFRLSLTTPACKSSLAAADLGHALTLLDTTGPAPGSDLSLYARVVSALAESGAGAVTQAVQTVGAGLDVDRAGAELAVACGRSDLVAESELVPVLRVVRDLLTTAGDSAGTERAADALTRLPSVPGPEDAVLEWAALYSEARKRQGASAQTSVDEAIDRLMQTVSTLPQGVPATSSAAVTSPSVARLAPLLKAIEAAEGPPTLTALLSGVSRLGLVGLNEALDRRLAEAIAEHFDAPEIQSAFKQIGADNGRIVESVVFELASRARSDRAALKQLGGIFELPGAREAVRRYAQDEGGFAAQAVWQTLRVSADAESRSEAVNALSALAGDPTQEAVIRRLFGKRGPVRPQEHLDLVKGYAAAGRAAPIKDVENALVCLAELPLTQETEARPLIKVLSETSPGAKQAEILRCWQLAILRPSERVPWLKWAQAAADVGHGGLPRARVAELCAISAEGAIDCLGEPGYAESMQELASCFRREWPAAVGTALAKVLAKSRRPERIVAAIFDDFSNLPRRTGDLVETALPLATARLSAKQLELVPSELPRSMRGDWEDWIERHPPRGVVGRAVKGIFGGRDR